MLLIVAATMNASTALLQATPSPDPAASPPALCTDRPTKATAACTVPKGKLQIETDLVNWTRNRAGGVRTETWLYTNPLIKYGLSGATDIEASMTPYQTVLTRGPAGSSKIGGIGDLTLRVKQRLTPSDAQALFALEPYVKIPTAKAGIGNGKLEGGLIGTGVFSLPNGFSLTVSPEFDLLANSNGDGRHVQWVGAANIGKTLSSTLTVYAELWAARNDDPGGHVRQYSADLAMAVLATPTLQIDAGTNIGLNRDTPDVQAYVGVSTRF